MKESQKEPELVPFLELIEGATSILEIGSRYGETLVRMAEVCAPGARIICVDMPNVETGREGSEAVLTQNADKLCAAGFDCRVFLGNSHNPNMVTAVSKQAPFDVVFIDGDHSLEGVTQDWEDYGTMGKMVAFHDAASTSWPGPAELWEDLKKRHRHEEFFDLDGDPLRYMGIGVLWPL